MKQISINAYILQTWLDVLSDCGKEPLIVIDPTRTERPVTVPMDYCIDGFLTLNVAAQALGYFSIDKESGYLMMSSRFNRVNQEMEIPIESIVVVRSPCGTINLSMKAGLVLLGGDSLIQEDKPKVLKQSKLKVIR